MKSNALHVLIKVQKITSLPSLIQHSFGSKTAVFIGAFYLSTRSSSFLFIGVEDTFIGQSYHNPKHIHNYFRDHKRNYSLTSIKATNDTTYDNTDKPKSKMKDHVNSTRRKPRILCLHGRYQSGDTFSNKIAGARRKLARVYDLEFLDGPIRLNPEDECSDIDNSNIASDPPAFAWWLKDENTGQHSRIREGLEYVLRHMMQQDTPYEGLIGFSQGGVVATALCCSGLLSSNNNIIGSNNEHSIRAVVTAGSPMVEEAFEVANAMANGTATRGADFLKESCYRRKEGEKVNSVEEISNRTGYRVPKLHLAGQKDAMIPIESTKRLCERGGNGLLLIHEQGHLFPTRAGRVQEIMDFMGKFILEDQNENLCRK